MGLDMQAYKTQQPQKAKTALQSTTYRANPLQINGLENAGVVQW